MRRFVSPVQPDGRGEISVSGADFRHFRAVRAEVGDMVDVLLPGGGAARMTVARIDGRARSVTLSLCGSPGAAPERRPVRLWLFQFVPKAAKFDQIVRQAAECGVERIFPVVSEFSRDGAARTDFRSERFARIVREAMQQSGSPVETVVEPSVTVDGACGIWRGEGEGGRALVLWERSERTTDVSAAIGGAAVPLCALAVGAEGGISADEVGRLEAAGFVPVHLRTNILRCETAALYGIAVVQDAAERLSERAECPAAFP